MKYLALLIKAVDIVYALVAWIKDAQARMQERERVLREIEDRNRTHADEARKVDEATARDDLGELERRMRDHQRATPD